MRKHFGLCKRKSFRLNDFKKRIDLSNSISSVYSPAVTTVQDWNPQSRVLHGGASRLHKMGNGLQLVSGRLGLCWEYSSVSLGIFQWDSWTWRRPGFPASEQEERLKREGGSAWACKQGIKSPNTDKFSCSLRLQFETRGIFPFFFFFNGRGKKKYPWF